MMLLVRSLDVMAALPGLRIRQGTWGQAMFLVFFPRCWACDMIPCQETTICREIDSLDQA